MFADAATNAAFGIDIGLLEPYLNRYRSLGLRRWVKWKFAVYRQATGGIGDNLAASPCRAIRNDTKIISGGILIRNQYITLKFDMIAIGIFDQQRLLNAHGIEQLPGKYCLRADRAIFLTDDTGSVHGPRQASAAVDKGRPNFYGTLIHIWAQPLALFKADRPDGCCRAEMTAGDAIVLTSAGADSEIKHR